VFFAVNLERGGPSDWRRDLREQDDWDEHARFMDSFVDYAFVVLGGPLGMYATGCTRSAPCGISRA
jgi:hypothetical protein